MFCVRPNVTKMPPKRFLKSPPPTTTLPIRFQALLIARVSTLDAACFLFVAADFSIENCGHYSFVVSERSSPKGRRQKVVCFFKKNGGNMFWTP